MFLSIGIIAMNEEQFLPLLLQDILDQTFDLSKVELILVDSLSTDSTPSIMHKFKEKNSSRFKDILILENPKKIQSAGWNVVIDNYSGDSLTRLDAHSRIPHDFLKEVLDAIHQGEKVVGGPRPNVLVENATSSQEILYVAENLKFGSGVSKARRESGEQYVNSMFHATYLREVIEATGKFNEKLLRTEDNEYHYRVREQGYHLFFTNKIISYQYARPSIKGFFKQKYGNGYWIGVTALYNHKIIEWYHLVPFLFTIFVFFSVVFSSNLLIRKIFISIILFYFITIIMSIIRILFSRKKLINLFVVLVIPMMHLSYGLGTVLGIANSRRELS